MTLAITILVLCILLALFVGATIVLILTVYRVSNERDLYMSMAAKNIVSSYKELMYQDKSVNTLGTKETN